METINFNWLIVSENTELLNLILFDDDDYWIYGFVGVNHPMRRPSY